MKIIKFLSVVFIFLFYLQTEAQQVIATAGGYYEGETVMLGYLAP